MNGKSVIDQILTGTYKLPLLDADNSARRAQILEWVNESVQRLWYARGWPFRRAVQDPVTLSSGVGELPSTFQSINAQRFGGVWVKSTGVPLRPISESEMRSLRNVPGGIGDGDPSCYSIYGINTSDYTQKINCDTTGSTQLIVAFEQTPPAIVDDDTDTSLSAIPAAFHQSCVVPCVRAFAQKDLGEDGDPDMEIEKAVARMARAIRPDADGPKQMPRMRFGGWI